MLNAKVLILGMTFKENCPDLRNSKVIDVILELEDYGINVDVYDPWVSSEVASEHFNINLVNLNEQKYNAMFFAVAHEQFVSEGEILVNKHGGNNCVVYDLKNILPKHIATVCL